MNKGSADLSGIISYIDQVRKQMEKVVKEVDPQLEICPGWTIKEAISHITAWEIVIEKALKAYQAGDPPYFLREQDFDVFNQESVDYRSSWSLAQVLGEWRKIRSDLKETIQKLDESDLGEELVLPWGSERSIAELIEIAGEHEEEHLNEIIKASG
jgi:hypothetical protein